MAEPRISASLPFGVKALLLRLALFLSPLILLVVLLEAVLWKTGESWPLRKVHEAQERSRDAIFMRGVLDQSLYAYKWRGVLGRRPEVLALGSSRVMKFRSEMFGDAGAFYNAGGLVTSVADLEAFVERLPADRTPRLVILGVDSWWLRPGRSSEEAFRVSHDGALSWQEHLLALRTFLKDPRLARAALGSLVFPPADDDRIGIHAQARGQGFRFDGSLDSGRALRRGRGWSFVDTERPTTARKIRTGAGFFKPARAVSGPRLQALRDAIERLRDRGVLVVGFAPPLCSEAVGLLETDPRHRRFWSEYRESLEGVFAELNLPYVDASSPGLLGLDDRYMMDGIHGGETLHVHILRRMLDDPRVGQAVPDAASILEAAIRSSRTNFWRADIPEDVALSEQSNPDEG